MENTKRIKELKQLIAKYDKQYYEEGVSEISDAEYDRLYDEYLGYESKYPELKEMDDAPTKRVGAGKEAGTTTGLPKFTHKSPLLSIDQKSKDMESLKHFYEKCGGEKVDFIVEPKLDGITCNINYEDGLFVNAATRGNGYIGDLITNQFKNTDTKYPKFLNGLHSLEIRGEAIIPFDYFSKHLANDYSNPRNAVAGIMRQIEAKDVKGKGVQVMFYDLGQTDDPSFGNNDIRNVNAITKYGFQSVPIEVARTWEDLREIVETKMHNRIQNVDGFNVLMEPGFPQAVCDGLVIKVAEKKHRDEIGMSEKGPKWCFAYKFKPLQAETRINYIEWQVGKSGRVTPVAVFDEVSLGGTKITRATLNNYDYMQTMPVENSDDDKGLKIDDIILVERSNDVIPRVVAIKKRSELVYPDAPEIKAMFQTRKETFNAPTVCPVCGEILREEYPLHFCINPLCSAQIKGKIEHYASRDAMNIVGLGEGIIDVLYKEGFLSDIPSIYSLALHQTELESLPKFGKRKVEKLIQSIEDTKHPELWQFIYALSIEGVGKKASKDLAQRYRSIDNFLQASLPELLSMDDFGEITGNIIVSTLHNPAILATIQKLREAGVEPKAVEKQGEMFEGMTFVITGTLENPRKYYQDIIEKNGGKVAGSVSKKTSVVLIGADAGSKETKARNLVESGAMIILLDSEEKIKEFLNDSRL